MMTLKKPIKKTGNTSRADFFEHLWEKSWTYIKTVVDVVREPVLILDKDFRVIAANNPFYLTFQVEAAETEDKIIYELGNGQWDIPDLRKLLENILPTNSFFKGFEVTHSFPYIGKKAMILNARQIYLEEDTFLKGYGPLELSQHIILLAIEDVTEMMNVAETLAKRTKRFEDELRKHTKKMEVRVEKLREEIDLLKQNSVANSI